MGLLAWLLAATSTHSMRVTGLLVTALAGAVTVVSTPGPLTVDALAGFASAHHAYPVALGFELSLLALGDETPLLGR